MQIAATASFEYMFLSLYAVQVQLEIDAFPSHFNFMGPRARPRRGHESVIELCRPDLRGFFYTERVNITIELGGAIGNKGLLR